MLPHVRAVGFVAGARCCQPDVAVQAHVSETFAPLRVPRRMNCRLALSYVIEARTSAGADAAGVIAGAPQVFAGGVRDGFAEGLLDPLGVGLLALGLLAHAIEARRARA